MDPKFIFVGDVAEHIIRNALSNRESNKASLLDSLNEYALCNLGLGVVNLSARGAGETGKDTYRVSGRIRRGIDFELTENRVHCAQVLPQTVLEKQNAIIDRGGAQLSGFIETPVLGARSVVKVLEGISGFGTTYMLANQHGLVSLEEIMETAP